MERKRERERERERGREGKPLSAQNACIRKIKKTARILFVVDEKEQWKKKSGSS